MENKVLEVGDYVITQQGDGLFGLAIPIIARIDRVNKNSYHARYLSGGEVTFSKVGLKEMYTYYYQPKVFAPVGKEIPEYILKGFLKAQEEDKLREALSRLAYNVSLAKTYLDELYKDAEVKELLDKYCEADVSCNYDNLEDYDDYDEEYEDGWLTHDPIEDIVDSPDYEAEERGDNDPACWEGDSLEAQETDEWIEPNKQ